MCLGQGYFVNWASGVNPVRSMSNGGLPRINEESAGRFEITNISGHDVQSVTAGGSGDQPIAGMDGSPGFLREGRNLAPNAAGFDVYGKKVVRVKPFQSLKPSL